MVNVENPLSFSLYQAVTGEKVVAGKARNDAVQKPLQAGSAAENVGRRARGQSVLRYWTYRDGRQASASYPPTFCRCLGQM